MRNPQIVRTRDCKNIVTKRLSSGRISPKASLSKRKMPRKLGESYITLPMWTEYCSRSVFAPAQSSRFTVSLSDRPSLASQLPLGCSRSLSSVLHSAPADSQDKQESMHEYVHVFQQRYQRSSHRRVCVENLNLLRQRHPTGTSAGLQTFLARDRTDLWVDSFTPSGTHNLPTNLSIAVMLPCRSLHKCRLEAAHLVNRLLWCDSPVSSRRSFGHVHHKCPKAQIANTCSFPPGAVGTKWIEGTKWYS